MVNPLSHSPVNLSTFHFLSYRLPCAFCDLSMSHGDPRTKWEGECGVRTQSGFSQTVFYRLQGMLIDFRGKRFSRSSKSWKWCIKQSPTGFFTIAHFWVLNNRICMAHLQKRALALPKEGPRTSGSLLAQISFVFYGGSRSALRRRWHSGMTHKAMGNVSTQLSLWVVQGCRLLPLPTALKVRASAGGAPGAQRMLFLGPANLEK